MWRFSFSNRHGVTAIEILAVMSILAIFLGIAAPRVADVQATFRLNRAVRRVALELRRTRLRAVESGRRHRVVLTAGASAYRVQRRERRTYVDLEPPRSLPEGVRIVECTARGAAISFSGYGTAGSFGTIALGNEQGQQRRLIVDIAGRMRVE